MILAVLSDSAATAINLIKNHIIPREKALPPANFMIIRAKCELAHCYLLEGEPEAAQVILDEVEIECFDKNGFPGQGTILCLISRLKQKLE